MKYFNTLKQAKEMNYMVILYNLLCFSELLHDIQKIAKNII